MSKESIRSGLVGGVIGALLVGLIGPALAAAGDSLKLGETNWSGAVTMVKGVASPNLKIINTVSGGTALELRVEGRTPPLTVNSSGRVRNLNADKLDGRHASAFLQTGIYDANGNRKADQADNADRLDGLHADGFLMIEGYDANKNWEVDLAEEADTVDGKHSFEFLSRWGKARDANHADDADALQGYEASQLIRVTQSSIDNAPDRDGIARQASITAPVPGWLIVSGSIDGRGDEYDIYTCRVQVDGVNLVGSGRASTVDMGGPLNTINDEENCSTEGVKSVAAGEHTVALRVDRVGDTVNFGPAVVWALFVPFNGQGNTYSP